MASLFGGSSDDVVQYRPVGQSEQLTTSLTAPDPEELAQPATSAVSGSCFFPGWQSSAFCLHCTYLICFFQAVIEVVAPATLMEGYELETKVGDQIIKVKVPAGGVAKGQKFTAPMPTNLAPTISGKKRYQVPIGSWKDGLCDCCQYGCGHATCCWGFWGVCYPMFYISQACCLFWAFPALGSTQVATRMNLDWLGRPVENNNLQRGTITAWHKFGYITAAFVAFQTIMVIIRACLLEDVMTHSWNKQYQTELGIVHALAVLCILISLAYFVLCIYIIFKVR